MEKRSIKNAKYDPWKYSIEVKKTPLVSLVFPAILASLIFFSFSVSLAGSVIHLISLL